MLSYLQAVVIGVLQGVTELFPVSSLGHSVLVPAWIGGSWQRLVTGESAPESPYLAFIVGLHVATALALVVYYRETWVRIVRGLVRSIRARRVVDADARLGVLLVLCTIPVGIVGLALEHTLRTLFAKPLASAIFLLVNGLILLAGERLRRRSVGRQASDPARSSARLTAVGTDARPVSEASEAPAASPDSEAARDAVLAGIPTGRAVGIGSFQILALLAGISRSGVTMVGGLLSGLDHEDAARFSFLLATPVILAAGVYKVHDLFGPNGHGILGQVLAGSIAAAVAAYFAVRFLARYFTTRTLTPFAVYCLVAGAASVVRFGVIG